MRIGFLCVHQYFHFQSSTEGLQSKPSQHASLSIGSTSRNCEDFKVLQYMLHRRASFSLNYKMLQANVHAIMISGGFKQCLRNK